MRVLLVVPAGVWPWDECESVQPKTGTLRIKGYQKPETQTQYILGLNVYILLKIHAHTCSDEVFVRTTCTT